MISRFFNSVLWIFPFISFFLGYQLLNVFYGAATITAPNLVGKQLADATKMAAHLNLNIRIISEKIDTDLPEGTVLSQTPAKQNIKPNQSIFVVISKKPDPKTAPYLYGSLKNTTKQKLATLNLKSKNYYLPSNSPKDSCICQMPSPGQELKENKIIIYISSGTSEFVIMPNFIGQEANHINEELLAQDITPNISYCPHDNFSNGVICNQSPAPGTIINLEKLNRIKLYTTKNSD